MAVYYNKENITQLIILLYEIISTYNLRNTEAATGIHDTET